ncbi:TIGR03016 family PEP-CTERM system-associated outer membrane protein [Telmatospirillum sp.]|uniref:TIGR03016 family PEP-CTERM system-associated outer membrane protein n=1 Tax=Telmatospirillum sp. TaxID=2079197 RepID=UPI00284FF56A|nr:TIGR03016 family PEP-CTERM system-associated outer membrane protein [Telmatospirillum sp.]MDR3439949.1 TIGR03016 family PEP-CTERM system-associated outer membrane protein [Telmatospirillum sp.]
MGARLCTSQTALFFGMALLVGAPSAWAQLVPGNSGLTGDIGQATPLTGGGAAQMFSAFPNAGAASPPTLSYPGYTPSVEAQRPFGFRLGLEGDEKWSDNVFSTAQGGRFNTSSNTGKKADFITTVASSVGVDVNSKRLQGALDYNLAYDRYASNTRLDGYRENGLGVFDSELIDKLFFVDARGSVSEQNTSSNGAITAGSRTAATNLTRVYTGSVTPRLQQKFGDWAVGQVSYHHDETHNENASQISQTTSLSSLSSVPLNDSHTDGGRVEMRNGNYFSRFFWDYSGDYSRNVSSGATYEQTTHNIGTEYRLIDSFGLLAAGGHDHLHNTTTDLSKYGGGYYSGGVHWTPSPDTDVRLGAGRRYDHNNWTALAEHHFSPMTVIRLSEDTGVTNDALSFEQALGAVQRGPNGGFVDPFSGLSANPSSSPFGRSNALYWQRNTNLLLRHDELRDSFALAGRVAEQRLLTNIAATTTSTALAAGTRSTVTGADLSWSHQFDPATSGIAALSPSVTRSTNNALNGSKRFQGSLALNHSLNETLTGSLGYYYAATISESSGNTRENLVSVGLRKTF